MASGRDAVIIQKRALPSDEVVAVEPEPGSLADPGQARMEPDAIRLRPPTTPGQPALKTPHRGEAVVTL
jgi:hypothetical protein